jgi:hypothetical protein
METIIINKKIVWTVAEPQNFVEKYVLAELEAESIIQEEEEKEILKSDEDYWEINIDWDAVVMVLTVTGHILVAIGTIVLAFFSVMLQSMADSVCG